MDNIGNGISVSMIFARSIFRRERSRVLYGADWGMDQLHSFEAYSEIEKKLEKDIIKTLYVPAKKTGYSSLLRS